MGIYLLKFTACLAVLYFFYKLCLENESMHTFKRSYLLVSLAAALLIPALVFTEYVEVPPITNIPAQEYSIPQVTDGPIGIPVALEKDILDIEPILWAVYFIGVLFFGIKFLKNLIQIFKRIQGNPKQRWQQYFHVLLKEQLPPHTFLSYIFLNKSKFEAGEIPKEVLLHEQTHARQKHSYDILLVEFLQVVFWMNPFIYLLKKAIKLNHEFLADQEVIKKGISQTKYQNTLLSYLSHDSFEKQESTSMANAINYSSIKKRFKLMKRHTSKKGILIRGLLLLPLAILLLYGFSETKNVIKESEVVINTTFTSGKDTNLKRDITIAGLILDSESLEPIADVALYDSKGQLLTKADNNGYYQILFTDFTAGELFFEFSLQKKGYKSLIQKEHWGNLQGKITSSFFFGLQKNESKSPEFSKLLTNVSNLSYESILENKTQIDLEHSFNKKIEIAKKGNQDVVFEIDNKLYLVNTHGWIGLNSNNDIIAVDDEQNILASKLNSHISRNSIRAMSPLEDYDDAQFAIYTTSGDINKKLDDRAFIKYNSLAKKYNSIPVEERTIPINDFAVLEFIYQQMTPEQKTTAQPFPKYSSNTQDGVTAKELKEYNKLAKHYNSMSRNKMKIYKKDVERLEYLFSIMSDEQKSNAEPFPDFPEPPPAPKAPNTPNEREEATNTIQKIIEEQDPYDVVNSGIRTNPKGKKVVFPQSGTFYKEMEKDVELQTEKMKEQEMLMKNEESKLKEREALMQQEKIKLEKEEAKLKKQEIEMTRQEDKMQEQEEMMKHMEAELEKKEDIFAIENVQVFQYNNRVSSGQRARLREYLGASDLKNAQFYFEGKKVSSKEGMKIIEKEKDIKVETRPHTNKQPEVRIYKATRNKTIPAPPKPPTPVTPLDHVIAMAKKDAQFIFEGKEISSDKAIKLMKTNKDLNIDSRTVKGKKPVVNISASPIPH